MHPPIPTSSESTSLRRSPATLCTISRTQLALHRRLRNKEGSEQCAPVLSPAGCPQVNTRWTAGTAPAGKLPIPKSLHDPRAVLGARLTRMGSSEACSQRSFEARRPHSLSQTSVKAALAGLRGQTLSQSGPQWRGGACWQPRESGACWAPSCHPQSRTPTARAQRAAPKMMPGGWLNLPWIPH